MEALDRLRQLEGADADSAGSLSSHFRATVAAAEDVALQLKRERHTYSTVVETMREIALKSLDLNRFEQYTLNTLRGQFGVLKVYFFRQKDYGDNEIGVHTARLRTAPPLRIRLDSEFAEYARHHPNAIDLAAPPRDIADMGEVEGLRELDIALLQPLVKKDEAGEQSLMGLVGLGRRLGSMGYTEADCEFLSLLGSMAGVTLYNAHLYQRSIVDNLTQVYSRGHFDIHLEQEVARAERFNEERDPAEHTGVTLVMLDIDHFKQFNDRYGHQVGDLVLAGVAQALKVASRAMDVVCRYGGEEFGVIFPDVTPDKAMMIAERLRTSVEKQPFETAEHGNLKVTISAGFATYPVDAQDARTLIARSDAALYAAKHAGRNRVARAIPPDSAGPRGPAGPAGPAKAGGAAT
ncbi:MAG: GGDEF domain-containing protein [Planctomycetota bacterium]